MKSKGWIIDMPIIFDPDDVPEFDNIYINQAFEWLRRKGMRSKSKNNDHAQVLCSEMVRLKRVEEYIKNTTGQITNSDDYSKDKNEARDNLKDDMITVNINDHKLHISGDINIINCVHVTSHGEVVIDVSTIPDGGQIGIVNVDLKTSAKPHKAE